MSLSEVDRGDAAVFMLLSEHDSLEAQFGRHGDICLTVLCVCIPVCVTVSPCGSQPELSHKLFCLFPIDVTGVECSQN